jgi:hypothetical protein
MDTVQEYARKPWVIGIIAFVVGLLIGWFLLGYALFPVQWYDAAPSNLRPDLQVDWVNMSAESYSVNQNAALAQRRWADLGEYANDSLQKAIQAGTVKPEILASYAAVVGAVQAPGTPTPGTPTPGAVTTPTQPAAAGGGSLIRVLLPIMCLITLLLAGALVAAFLLRGRVRPPKTGATAGQPSQEEARQAQLAEYEARGEEPPMAQFVASYKIGDDMFDDSFSVDSPAGEFLGECGVGISETIGVGDPKKVTAFEVWLFDKNDIQTVTKVLMSAHAFTDETIRQRLAAKGEPVQATPGTQLVLETATLQLVARVVDMSYGEGPLPPDSFFENAILELAVWQK